MSFKQKTLYNKIKQKFCLSFMNNKYKYLTNAFFPNKFKETISINKKNIIK